MTEPPFGITTTAKIIKVVDADTVDVEIRRILRIRLIDCYAPERYSQDGKLAKEALLNWLTQHSKEVKLHIPPSEKDELTSILTLNRFLGHIWVDSGENISEYMVDNGYATKTKPKKK